MSDGLSILFKSVEKYAESAREKGEVIYKICDLLEEDRVKNMSKEGFVAKLKETLPLFSAIKR